MWISNRSALSKFAEQLSGLREELAAAQAARAFAMQRMTELKIEHLRELEEVRRRLAISQANFEWLSVSHNQVSAEVQALRNARSGVNLPPMEIAFVDRAVTQPNAEPPARAAASADDTTVADTIDAGISFEDMGDRAAAIQGVTGRLYDGSDTLLRD